MSKMTEVNTNHSVAVVVVVVVVYIKFCSHCNCFQLSKKFVYCFPHCTDEKCSYAGQNFLEIKECLFHHFN